MLNWLGSIAWRAAAPYLAILAVVVGAAQFLPHQQNQIAEPQPQYETTDQLPWGGVAEIAAAAFTGILALFAFVQVRDSRISDERQSRAYIFVRKARVDNFGVGQIPEAIVSLKNFGKTPADTVAAAVRLGIQPYPLSGDFPDLSSDTQRPLGPDEGFKMHMRLNEPLTQGDVDALKEGTQALYLIGRVSYRSRFGKPCDLNFCLFSGTKHVPLGSFAAYPTGNTYT